MYRWRRTIALTILGALALLVLADLLSLAVR